MNKFKFLSERRSYKTTEAYKALRTNIMFSGSDVKVVVITSCSPDDGKSYVSRNLAVSLAQAGKKVLMIDADLRKSAMSGNIEADDEVLGLSHFLTGQAELSDVVMQNKDCENLCAIFAGTFPPDPSELLGGEEFRGLIEKAREDFDYVIIDTPPLGAVIDSAVVSSLADGIALVIRARRTSYRLAQGVKEQLEKTGCRILGVILNGVDFEDKDKYYYRNYYYYNDYSKYYRYE